MYEVVPDLQHLKFTREALYLICALDEDTVSRTSLSLSLEAGTFNVFPGS